MTRLPLAVAAAALLSFALLALGNVVSMAPTSDEITHLPAGYISLSQHDFRSNPEHPPLVKMLAALPLRFMDLWPEHRAGEGHRALEQWRKSWDNIFNDPTEQWRLGWLLLYGRKDAVLGSAHADPVMSGPDREWTPSDFLNDSQRMFIAGRTPVVLLGVACGVFVFLWSRELWGAWGAAASTLLFAFDPSFIAHSALVTTDVAMATFAVATMYFFWRACRNPTIFNAAAFVISFGLAQTVKFSGIFLAAIVIITGFWSAIAARMVESLQVSAQLTTVVEVDDGLTAVGWGGWHAWQPREWTRRVVNQTRRAACRPPRADFGGPSG